MTTNYAINVIVADVGLITDRDKSDVAAIIGQGVSVVHFTTDLHELHLYWPVSADTLDNAIDAARTMLREAINATGAAYPRTRKFEVCEIGR